MKIRNGFVSNSSSSSFIVAVAQKNPVAPQDLRESLGVKKGSVADQLFSPLLDVLFKGGKILNVKTLAKVCNQTVEEFLADYPDVEEFCKLQKDGWVVRIIDVSNDSGNPFEAYFYDNDPEIKTDTVIIRPLR